MRTLATVAMACMRKVIAILGLSSTSSQPHCRIHWAAIATCTPLDGGDNEDANERDGAALLLLPQILAGGMDDLRNTGCMQELHESASPQG